MSDPYDLYGPSKDEIAKMVAQRKAEAAIPPAVLQRVRNLRTEAFKLQEDYPTVSALLDTSARAHVTVERLNGELQRLENAKLKTSGFYSAGKSQRDKYQKACDDMREHINNCKYLSDRLYAMARDVSSTYGRCSTARQQYTTMHDSLQLTPASMHHHSQEIQLAYAFGAKKRAEAELVNKDREANVLMNAASTTINMIQSRVEGSMRRELNEAPNLGPYVERLVETAEDDDEHEVYAEISDSNMIQDVGQTDSIMGIVGEDNYAEFMREMGQIAAPSTSSVAHTHVATNSFTTRTSNQGRSLYNLAHSKVRNTELH